MKLIFKETTTIDHCATGAMVRHQRKARSISGKRVADIMGIPRSLLSDLEAGRRNWTQDRLDSYAAAIRRLTSRHARA